jgi:hypothetical protein
MRKKGTMLLKSETKNAITIPDATLEMLVTAASGSTLSDHHAAEPETTNTNTNTNTSNTEFNNDSSFTNISSLTSDDVVAVNVQLNVFENNGVQEATVRTSMEGGEESNEEIEHDKVVKRGRKRGSINHQEEAYLQAIKEAVTKVTLEFNTARSIASQSGSKVANGTLTTIIATTKDAFNLKKGSIRPKTITCRLLRKNLHGVAKLRISPIKDIEPIIVE